MNTIKCYLYFTQLLTNKINMNMYVYMCVHNFYIAKNHIQSFIYAEQEFCQWATYQLLWWIIKNA